MNEWEIRTIDGIRVNDKREAQDCKPQAMALVCTKEEASKGTSSHVTVTASRM
jgi:hypothetical protein